MHIPTKYVRCRFNIVFKLKEILINGNVLLNQNYNLFLPERWETTKIINTINTLSNIHSILNRRGANYWILLIWPHSLLHLIASSKHSQTFHNPIYLTFFSFTFTQDSVSYTFNHAFHIPFNLANSLSSTLYLAFLYYYHL